MRRRGQLKVEKPRSWGEYVDLIARPQYQGWAFRGHANRKWPLMSTLGRYLNAYVEEKYWKDQEERIIRVFKRKAHLFLTHIPDHSDTYQWLALMQHHGAPTRLLDFTWSPYVAAFFALERATRKGAVWALNPRKLENITERLNEFLVDPKGAEIGIGEPFVMNTRLIAQSGTFVVTRHPGKPIEEIVGGYDDPSDTLVKFVLPVDLIRSSGMRALFMMNVTNATLFPDLDGLARSLAYELEFHFAHDPRKIPKSPPSSAAAPEQELNG